MFQPEHNEKDLKQSGICVIYLEAQLQSMLTAIGQMTSMEASEVILPASHLASWLTLIYQLKPILHIAG
jgi:hypothetical protein